MKKTTLYAALAAAIIGIPGAYAAPASLLAMKKVQASRAELVKKQMRTDAPAAGSSMRRAESAADWQPTGHALYEWTGEDWELNTSYTTTYNGQGLPAIELDTDAASGQIIRTSYTYDSEGRIVERLREVSEGEGEPFENYMLLKREYDPRMTSLIISNIEKNWYDGGWNRDSNSYRRTVTRNTEGNVTEVVVSTIFGDEVVPVERMFVEYGADGKATRIYNQTYVDDPFGAEGPSWEDGEEYSDIEWLETDGQFPEMSTFCIGPNRFKKAKYTSEGMYIGEINVEYSGVNYTATLVNEEGTNVEKFSVTDDFGGYELSITLSGEDEGDPFEMVTYESASYDRWGHDLAILAYDSATFGGETEVYLNEWVRGKVEMAENKDYPASYTRQEYVEEPLDEEYPDEEEDEYLAPGKLRIPEMPAGTWENTYRIEYTEWTDLSGLGSVGADSDNAPAEYFNLQGMRVDNPSKGIFIKRQGSKVTKLILR